MERVEKSIQHYLSQMDTQDNDEKTNSDKASESKLAWLKQRLVELKAIEEEVNEHPDKQISQTDPDSRLMQTHQKESQVCYNIQSAVDIKHHLIISHDVTNTPDRGQLSSVTREVQDALKTKNITVIADKGYFSRNDIKATQDLGAEANVPQTDTSGAAKKGTFNKSLFNYDKDNDIFICPAGEVLQNRMRVFDSGLEQDVYFNHIACKNCSIRAKCTTSKREPRRMHRWIHEADIEAMQARLDAAPDTSLIRKQTVEHPFGTIKMWMGATHFLTKRLESVGTEMSLSVLAYNLKRMMSIKGTTGLMEAMMA